MDAYEAKVWREVLQWRRSMKQPSSGLQRLSKKLQGRVAQWIPEKVHQVMTEAVKSMVQAVLWGSEYTTRKVYVGHLNFEAVERPILAKIQTYKKTAAVEGAGTGAGGLLLGLADFPLLLSIKMKLLFEIAALYGVSTDRFEERMYVLQLFQLAFSSDERRLHLAGQLDHWKEQKLAYEQMDWRVFQQEYRDYIDFSKMLQLVPIIGAPVGAVANYHLVDHLGKTAMNGYRLRLLGPKARVGE